MTERRRLRRPRHLAAALGLLALAGVPRLAASQDVSDIVDRASAHVARLGDALASVVADERYDQRWHPPGGTEIRRRLDSELVIVRTPDRPEWVGFRDVVAVDGEPVRERSDRLQQLFLEPGTAAWTRARTIADESARYNLGPVVRNFNLPTAALFFVHPANRGRFRFARGREEAPTDTRIAVLVFEEEDRPTLVRTPRGVSVPSRGRVWVETSTGHVVRTQLWLTTETGPAPRTVEVNVAVDYTLDPGVDLWVPDEMREEYITGDGERIVGVARYDNYRRFEVGSRVLPPSR